MKTLWKKLVAGVVALSFVLGASQILPEETAAVSKDISAGQSKVNYEIPMPQSATQGLLTGGTLLPVKAGSANEQTQEIKVDPIKAGKVTEYTPIRYNVKKDYDYDYGYYDDDYGYDDTTDNDGDYSSYIYNFGYQAYTDTSLTLTWDSQGNNTGFKVYRKCAYDSNYLLLGTVENTDYYNTYTFTDTKLVKGIAFSYKVVAYYVDKTTGEEVEQGYVANTYTLRFSAPTLSSVKRVSAKSKKVKLKWTKVGGSKGYIVYRKDSGKSYKKAKTITNSSTTTWTAGSVSTKTATSFKVRAYIVYSGHYIYSEYSNDGSTLSTSQQKISNKFKSLKKKFPNGRYWNHVGKSNWNTSTTTKYPCYHGYDNLASTCNYYTSHNVIGYQCYGFAWLLSDKIYGKKAKIKNFYSFSKCKMGDVIRYSGHSVIITEKHSNYIVAAECNYGNTCIIKWGRKIYKSELSGAMYSRRY